MFIKMVQVCFEYRYKNYNDYLFSENKTFLKLNIKTVNVDFLNIPKLEDFFVYFLCQIY